MKVAFTGHRDRVASPAELAAVAEAHPGATWVHGGAVGFDAQVAAFATEHGIPQQVIRPAYGEHGRAAPLIRNREIVDGASVLVACYDGRKGGGTAYTVGYARRRHVPVTILAPREG